MFLIDRFLIKKRVIEIKVNSVSHYRCPNHKFQLNIAFEEREVELMDL